MRQFLIVATIVVTVAVVGMLTATPSEHPADPPTASVLAIRDLHEIRFTNDSRVPLYNCTVQIDGFTARLNELPIGGRGQLARTAFDSQLPGDEFYRRSRRMEMGCLTTGDQFVEIRLK